MSAYRTELLYKGDPLYVVTVMYSSGQGQSLVFSIEKDWEAYEDYLVESAQELGIVSMTSAIVPFNCTLQDIDNMGEEDELRD